MTTPYICIHLSRPTLWCWLIFFSSWVMLWQWCLPLQENYVENGTMFIDFCELVGMKLTPQQQSQASANAAAHAQAIAAKRLK